MRKIAILLASIVLLPLLAGCGEEKGGALPAISGKAGEVIVVASKAQWESEVGNRIRGALACEYEYLPQKEPLFNLDNVPEASVNKLIKVFRNLLYLKVGEGQETGMQVRKDVFASPQTVVVVTAPTDDDAAAFISENGALIAEAFEKAERDRLQSNAKLYEEVKLRELVSAKFGGSPCFPNGYSLKKQTPDFVWISYETSYTIQGILIYSYPYENDSQLTVEKLIEKRNEVVKDNVPATSEGSYMITNPTIVPGFREVEYNGIKKYEVRSLWDTYGDFMGGPFVSQAFKSQDGKSIIVTEGFVYAPKYNKRNYLRQVESILCSFEWAK
ncbi:MAG: DUF4837 family protein [Bacteroidales bacterium]|nr:DUF4837 family protein [Bacteroidales bacterium]